MSHHNSIAENVLGTAGTICWTIQLIPQAWKNHRTKSTEGLSRWFMLAWGLSSIFLGAYAILQWLNIPLIVQPQLFGFLSFLCWGQCQYYGSKRSRLVSVFITIALMVASGLLQYILVFLLRPSHDRGIQGPTAALGIIASVITPAALLPQYWEIYKYKEVIGVSITFLLVDILGAVLNDLSLVFRVKFDIIAAITYTLVILADGLVIVLALLLNPLARRRRRRAREAEHAVGLPERTQPEVGEVST